MYEYKAKLIRVVDGDTVDLNVDLGFGIWREDRFRLFGLDAPERNTPDGPKATNWLSLALADDTHLTITTVKDKQDKYGRYLAIIFVGTLNVNERMVAEGFAKARSYKTAEGYYGYRTAANPYVFTSVNGGLHDRIQDDILPKREGDRTSDSGEKGKEGACEERTGREEGIRDDVRPRVPLPPQDHEQGGESG